MNSEIMHIDKTLSEICRAIRKAECTMHKHVAKYYHDANEEFITGLLYGQIKYALRTSSQKRQIEKAFQEDLEKAVNAAGLSDNIFDNQLSQESAGLIADIVLHNKQTEGRTGGDFGLVIVHPQILFASMEVGTSIEIKKGCSSGLLCQAKLKDRNDRWGGFTDKQEKILPGHLDFTALALYSYADEDRSTLNPISWMSCKGQPWDQIKNSLKKDSFQGSINTAMILEQLGRNEIGTQDQTLIKHVIAPLSRLSLEIKIHWVNDNDPDGTIQLRVLSPVSQKEQITANVRRAR